MCNNSTVCYHRRTYLVFDLTILSHLSTKHLQVSSFENAPCDNLIAEKCIADSSNMTSQINLQINLVITSRLDYLSSIHVETSKAIHSSSYCSSIHNSTSNFTNFTFKRAFVSLCSELFFLPFSLHFTETHDDERNKEVSQDS